MSENAFTDLNAERAVIGAAMMDRDAARIAAELPEDTFRDPQSMAAHAAIRELVRQDKEADLITVEARIRESGMNVPVDWLIDCSTYCPAVGNVKAYVTVLKNCAARRRMYLIGRDLMARAGDAAAEPDESREWAARQIRDLHVTESDRLISMEEAVTATYAKMGREQKDEGTRIMSGIQTLDEKLGGLRGSEMVVIGARPSVGKSILALTFCVAAAKQGKRVLLVSLEMNETEITERVLANEANVPLNAITSGRITTDHWIRMGASLGQIGRLPLWYCLEAGTVERVRKAAYALYEDGGLDLIAIDYLQLMEATYAKKQSRQEQIAEISRGLRKLSMEMGIPVIVLTQLNRSSERPGANGVKREPTMSEARESGAIEQDANIFILLHNPELNEMTTDRERDLWKRMDSAGCQMIRLIIDKNRQGKRGRLTVAFDGDHMRFITLKKEGEQQCGKTSASAGAAEK